MTPKPSTHRAAARSRLAAFAVAASATATALAAFASLPVVAQTVPSAPAHTTAPAGALPAPAGRAAARQSQPHMQPQHQQQQQTREQRRERWQQHRAERMAAFKAQLQLTPAQEQGWTDFTAALQPGQRHARLGREGEGMDQLTTPERIDRMRALRVQRAAEADRRGEAVKTFYATLSAQQQATFDARMHQQVQQRQQMHGRMSDRHGGKQHRHGGDGGRHKGGGMHHGHGPAQPLAQGGMQPPAPVQPGNQPRTSPAADAPPGVPAVSLPAAK